MSRIFTIKTLVLLILATARPAPAQGQPSLEQPTAVLPPITHPMKELFSHPAHAKSFREMGVACTDCHDFSIKPAAPGPLASSLPTGLLKPQKGVCHQCHLGKIALPTPNQCTLCHLSTAAIQPRDHAVDWKARHGRFAQFNRESCASCHSQQSCNQCHSRLDRMNPMVHPGSFRLFHSVRARANPQSCVQCHKTRAFCTDCHSGRRSQ
ncbi:MAG: hypothetical protein NDJ89_10170 [Oligoflexia bacterium]|nr:hypothetical protein [Oligoflexia bacterium]